MTERSRIEFRRILGDGAEALARALASAHPADVAEATEGLRDEDVLRVLAALGDRAGVVFEHLPPERQRSVLERLRPDLAAGVLEEMSSDDMADVLRELPLARAAELLRDMDAAEQARVAPLLAWPEGTAGALMASEVVTLREDMTVARALERLRASAPDAETIYYVYTVDADRRLRGVVSLRDLILADPDVPLSAIARRDVIAVRADDDQETVARTFEKYALLALPVVDRQGRVVGVVTVDDVMDVVSEEASEDAYRLAGLVEEVEAVDSPAIRASKRLPWLLVLLGLEAVGARIIGGFEHALQAVIALAYFIPMLNDQAGNMGVQSAAMAVRAIATGEVDRRSYRQFVLREWVVGVTAGLASGAVGLAIGLVWQGDLRLGLTLGTTLLVSMSAASVLGSLAPLVLTVLRKDPAVAAGPFITSTMDVINVLVYFSVAVWFFRPLLGG
ncbi:MAG: magnesium transporter [Armatimonadota bacterium]|nr:magnesium transporter [Armatimonadota bacterium]MDR5697306.1 magnesium transporter [Armatimonadota bacterium]